MSCDMTKLKYLKATKQLLREKIDPKGTKITDETPFRAYVDYISGGSAPALASAVAEGVVGRAGTAEMVYGMDIDLMGASWEQGSIYDNGNNFNSTARIRMPDYLDFSNASDIFYSGFTVTASADKKLQYTFVFFDVEKKNLNTSTNKDWLDVGVPTMCGTASAPSYVRVVLRHADNSDMTPDVLTSARLKILA